MARPIDDSISRRALLHAGAASLTAVAGGCTDAIPELATAERDLPFRFEEVTDTWGLAYETTGAGIANTSAGAYVGDVNNNGLEDVLLVGGEQPVLYENVGDGYKRAEGLPALGPYLTGDDRIHSALFLDYDTDGWEDLLLLPGGGRVLADYTDPVSDAPEPTGSNPLLLENVGGSFEVAEVLDVGLARWPIGAAAADCDGNGYPDVFIYQNGDWADGPPTGYHTPDTIGKIEQRPDLEDNGSPNLLLAGDGDSFEEVTAAAGIRGERWSLAASFADLTGNGRPDIHVANDFNEDVLYLNRGDGTFDQHFLGRASDRNQMSSEVRDLTGNDLLDIYVTNIEVDRDQIDSNAKRGRIFVKQQAASEPRYFGGNNLWINRGDGEFSDEAAAYEVKESPFTWGWAALMIDLNNNGDVDILHANNQVDRVTTTGDERIIIRSEATEPGIWANRGGNDFAPLRAREIGLDRMNERGLVSLDATADGRLDLLFVEDDGPARAYANRTRAAGNWFQAIIQGRPGQTSLGTKAWLTANGQTQFLVKDSKTDFQSQRSRVLHWGVGTATTIDQLRIRWPDGTERTFTDLAHNRRVRISPSGPPQEVAQ